MDGSQDVIFAKMYVLGINLYQQTKDWIKKLNINALQWSDDEWYEKLKGTTLKRIKPWMWRRNIQAIIQK